MQGGGLGPGRPGAGAATIFDLYKSFITQLPCSMRLCRPPFPGPDSFMGPVSDQRPGTASSGGGGMQGGGPGPGRPGADAASFS
jgi:hypothetical protein